MDTGVTNIVDDKYATASAPWLQVSRQLNAKNVLHIGIYIYIHACICVCVCVCVYIYLCVYVCTGILYV